ncbi:hypothetical protein CUMW_009070 [Citrus unshiu]|nr:hypothetical protein CUMW_009070 [Citrus unshiu]
MIGLSLAQNELAGTLPRTGGKLHKLQRWVFLTIKSLDTLQLNSKALQGQIPTCLANLTSLRHFNLSFNSLEYVLVVDFSLNSLSGSLPLKIGNLKGINYQVIHQAALGVPQSFGSLIGLESLDLSGNNLSGEIPRSLGELSHFNFFNHNHELRGTSRLQVPPCRTSSIHKYTATKLALRCILPEIAATMVILAPIVILIRCHEREKSLPTENNLLNSATLRIISSYEL